MSLLVTGCAGFIGFHFSLKKLETGSQVIGIDNLNDYYDVNLKLSRLNILKTYPNFTFLKIDIADREALGSLFQHNNISKVVNLAAQAGVRYSLTNPYAYTESNITGFINLIEQCRHHQIENLVYASSSSVYGANTKQPFSESEAVNHPLALYAATKKANELIAHSYSYLFQLPTTGLRFFTVYGPWGRPDMALFLFTKNILEDKPINVFNHGNMIRDFTYIDDIVSGIVSAVDNPATADASWNSNTPNPASSNAPYRIYNIGNNKPTSLMRYIAAIEKALGKKATLNMLPMQDGDVPSTNADINLIKQDLGYDPQVTVDEGVGLFVDWYMSYFK